MSLRPLTRTDLAAITPWFEDPDTRRYLGGPEWPAAMLDQGELAVGEMFRGAVQTAAYRYLAELDDRAVGYIDCGTFDRATVYGGEGPDGPIITDSMEVTTGSIAFAVDPAFRRRAVGRVMIAALLARPELAFVELFEAGVEPENVACRRCLEAAGFRVRSPEPDYEGMLYYHAARPVRGPQGDREPAGSDGPPAVPEGPGQPASLIASDRRPPVSAASRRERHNPSHIASVTPQRDGPGAATSRLFADMSRCSPRPHG